MRRLALVLVFAACSSKSHSTPPDGASDVDAAVDTPDSMPDAPMVQGKACPSALHEVARIPGANLQPDDRGFYGPTYKEGLFVRDADGDGKADVIVVEYVSSTTSSYLYNIRLFRQTASGFAAPVVSPVTFPASGPEVNAVGDFNGDHLLDVVFTYETDSPDREPFLYVALQNADHTFTLKPSVSISACKSSSDERLFALAITDVDHDGNDDVLATVSYGGLGAAPEGLTLMRGTTSGLAFPQCVRSATVQNAGYPADMISANALAAADFDGDGTVDFVESTQDDKLEFLHATGTATYQAVAGTAARPTWRVLQTNRVPGRMHQDMVNADITSTTTKLTRFTVDPTAGITAQVGPELAEGDPAGFGIVRGIVVGDFNGDGLTDVLESGHYENSQDPTPFGIACDRGARWDTQTGMFPTAINYLRTIDLAGDGKLGILAVAGSDVIIYSMQ